VPHHLSLCFVLIMQKLILLVAICLAVVVRADIESFLEAAGKFSNMSVDGNDLLVQFDGDVGSFELLSKMFTEEPSTSGFEVQACAGVCQNKNSVGCAAGYKSGLCPGPSNIVCCPMSTPSCDGQCSDNSVACSTGYQTGKCPGGNNIQCCPTSSGGGGGGGGIPPGTSAQRQGLYTAAMALYNNRASEHYTQGSLRWIGITDGIRPPQAPAYSDCSAAATWCYWTVFGSGPDFLNNQNWRAGYTGTMSGRGRSVGCSAMQIGDLAFYGNPISHVTISIGSGRVVSHGSDPVGLYAYNYRSDLNQCRTYL